MSPVRTGVENWDYHHLSQDVKRRNPREIACPKMRVRAAVTFDLESVSPLCSRFCLRVQH